MHHCAALPSALFTRQRKCCAICLPTVCVSSTSTKEFVGVKGVVSKAKYRQEMGFKAWNLSSWPRSHWVISTKKQPYRPLQILWERIPALFLFCPKNGMSQVCRFKKIEQANTQGTCTRLEKELHKRPADEKQVYIKVRKNKVNKLRDHHLFC